MTTTAKFAYRWHTVPAGTEVRVLRRFKDAFGDESVEVQSLDGSDMPCPYGRKTDRAVVSPDALA